MAKAKAKAGSSLAQAGKEPVAGRWYRLLEDYGAGVGAMQAERIDPTDPERQRKAALCVQVVDLVDAGTPGVGVADHVTPLVQWFDRAASGRLTCHVVQFPMDRFTALFTEAEEPPEWREYVDQVNMLQPLSLPRYVELPDEHQDVGESAGEGE